MFTVFFEKIFPIISFFAIGYSLKCLKVLKKDDAPVLLKLVFYLFSPAVIILSISSIELEKQFIMYPVSALCMHGIMYTLGLILSKFIKFESGKKRKIFRGSLLIMNLTFILPFFIMFFGKENVYLLSMFDAGNLLMVSSLAYSLIVSNDEDTFSDKIKMLFKSPLIISIIIGTVLNILNIKIPSGINVALEKIADCTGTVIMIALGVYFTPKFKNFKFSILVVSCKMIGMFLGALIIMNILPIDEVGKKLLLLGSFSPIGNNVLTYVMVSKGDIELASNVVSLSIIISFIMTTVLLVTF